MDAGSFTELIMKEKRLDVLNTLLENKGSEFTISSLSEKSGVGYKTTHGLVERLEGFGVIRVDSKGGSKFVSLNEDSPYVDVLEKLASIDSKPLKNVAEEFAGEIFEKWESIVSVVLFGSVVNGLPTEDSDIDILVLIDSNADVESVEEKVWAVRDRFERENKVNISPLVMDIEKFELEAENREPFASKIKSQGKVLKGEKL